MFLPYMGMAAIMVMLPRPFIQTYVHPSHGGFSLIFTGQAVLESFENGGRRWTDARV